MSERGTTNVVMNDDLHRFEMMVDGQIAFLRYGREGDRMILVHTEIPKRLEGHGLGTVLALAALDHARANDLTVVPRCPFVKAFLERHPEKAAGLKIAPDERKK
jgi:predicted GNAT family acetyltransferase